MLTACGLGRLPGLRQVPAGVAGLAAGGRRNRLTTRLPGGTVLGARAGLPAGLGTLGGLATTSRLYAGLVRAARPCAGLARRT
ncbi:hypothetical protein [Kribbella sp. DT2]|uniref:hypothetical protein n=1 Tax=Kribbella sp. DT2 TaxID=3393427 RepID=UPI003CE9F2AC